MRIKENTISGWQRLGIVVSILRLFVAAPIYLMAEWNEPARGTYTVCYILVSNTSYKTEVDRDAAKARCLAMFEEASMTPTKLLHLLFTTHENQNIMWIILLVPLVIF